MIQRRPHRGAGCGTIGSRRLRCGLPPTGLESGVGTSSRKRFPFWRGPRPSFLDHERL